MWRFFKNMNDKDFKEMVALLTILYCFVYFTVITFVTIPESGKRYADIIIPQGGNNEVAINILVSIIEKNLNKHTDNLTY